MCSKVRTATPALWRALPALAGLIWFHAAAVEHRGAQFIGLTRFGNFEKTRGTNATEMVLTSPVIAPEIQWDELVVSWNAEAAPETYLRVEARGIRFGRPTPWYWMGWWSPDRRRFPRESVLGQEDDHAEVKTDTLVMRELCDRVQVRFTLGGEHALRPRLTLVGLALVNSRSPVQALPPDRRAWGRVLPVPERSQMRYPNGNVICSPTTLSMMMGYWAAKLRRPELDEGVPAVADAVYDTNWRGTGNWVFNTAYAGSFRGIRSYVTRMTDLSELENWVAAGIPVGLSICYDRLRGRPSQPSGHLVVCVGFTSAGEVVINDPGTRENVRKVFSRERVADAWAYSRNAAYLVYPEKASVPADRFGHWLSWSSRQRFKFD